MNVEYTTSYQAAGNYQGAAVEQEGEVGEQISTIDRLTTELYQEVERLSVRLAPVVRGDGDTPPGPDSVPRRMLVPLAERLYAQAEHIERAIRLLAELNRGLAL